jgi:REP element-mobilizing transposase RayT
MNRGDRKEAIFIEDTDRLSFICTLEEACQKTSWQIHSFCLMSNHFHLVIETPSPNLAAGMKWFLGVYTSRFNRRHRLVGHLFSGRYKTLLVDGNGSGYLKSVCDYVHLNPVRASLLRPQEPLQTYHWSSYPLYLADRSARPAWLRVDRLFGECGIRWDQAGAARQFGAAMEARRQGEQDQQFKPVERDWCVGSEPFRADMLRYVETQRGEWHSGAELAEAAEAKAERLIREALRARGITEAHLASWRKGHPFKLALAAKLRDETTVTVSWLAHRLEMGTRGHLAHLLYRKDQATAREGGQLPIQPNLNL